MNSHPAISFDLQPEDLSHFAALRQQVREFLDAWKTQHGDSDWLASWMGFSAPFSRAIAEQGWVGMTWPRSYGGQQKSFLERYVVIEELLEYGSDWQKQTYLPPVTRGESFFCIGMSEPDSGSDLAAARTRAQRTDSGWLINGQKLWTSHGHRCHHAIVFCRTSPLDKNNRHAGFSQFIVDLTTPGIEIKPIVNIAGEQHFNAIYFNDVEVADESLVGEEGNGWAQVTGELAFERSGPERFMSNFCLSESLLEVLGDTAPAHTRRQLGRLVARYFALRKMSSAIAVEIAEGQSPDLKAALVKDIGTCFEQSIPELVRESVELTSNPESDAELTDSERRLLRLQNYNILHAPSFTLRGGTTEVLRGIVARGMGLR